MLKVMQQEEEDLEVQAGQIAQAIEKEDQNENNLLDEESEPEVGDDEEDNTQTVASTSEDSKDCASNGTNEQPAFTQSSENGNDDETITQDSENAVDYPPESRSNVDSTNNRSQEDVSLNVVAEVQDTRQSSEETTSSTPSEADETNQDSDEDVNHVDQRKEKAEQIREQDRTPPEGLSEHKELTESEDMTVALSLCGDVLPKTVTEVLKAYITSILLL